MTKTYSTNEIVQTAGRDAGWVVKAMKKQGSTPLSVHKTKTRTYRVWAKKDVDLLVAQIMAEREAAKEKKEIEQEVKAFAASSRDALAIPWHDLVTKQEKDQLNRIEYMVTVIYNDLYSKKEV